MLFKEIIGQDHLKSELIQSAKTGKVSQAMMFLGVEGSGTLPMALAFAQYLNCENQQEIDSCGVCNACKKASKYIHPDIFYTYPTIKAQTLSKDFITEWRKAISENPYMNIVEWIGSLENENKQGNITANECNQIVKQHSLKHYEGKYKIQIIWMAEFLKKEGNKLLKIIEEPPERTVFILISENIEHILVTILSRTQIVKFSRLNDKVIEENLIEKLQIDPSKARKIAQLTEGNWNTAKKLTISNQENNFNELFEWFELLMERNKDLATIQKLVEWVDKMGTIGRENQKLFFKHCLFSLRECLIFKTSISSKLNENEQILAQDVIKRLSLQDIANISILVNDLHTEVIRNANAKLGLMSASFQIAGYMNSH